MKKILTAGLTAALLLGFSPVAKAEYYTEKGDTLYKIARENEMSLNDLISLNPHISDPNKIKVGQYIVIRSAEVQKDLVDYARSLQESTKYVYGGADYTPPMETDCSGWVQAIYKKFGVSLPRTSAQQAVTAYGTPVKFQDLQIGDLMFFSTDKKTHKITHVGIYLGSETKAWISNLNSAKNVQILSSWGKWTQDNFMWGKRFKL